MLMLGVKEGDYIMIDDKIKIRVVQAGVVFRLGIEAPKEMVILRKSLYEGVDSAQEPSYPNSKPVHEITPAMRAKQKKQRPE